MRKAQKQQVEDFIKLLNQLHDEIKKAIETKRNAEVLSLLEQCQGEAIQLGNLIEQAEGEGFVTVKLLEGYCEMLYQMHEEIAQNPIINANKVYKNLRKVLLKIENSVKNDIKVYTEAVFLPYKASMWDSLESVWRAAEEDTNCDAYVIPIPYYDKNPDGSFREMHYEGDLYPEYVPITHYETFDFVKHRPDVIFIHNPYDNCNYVTSVHPFCYSKNLKQFTEQLVYIPYFILDEVKPDDEERVKSIEHFCNLPAVIYADKVIVQSEDMRQIYINAMMKLTGKEPYDRKYWEEKILGLGSPKVDKVLSTRKEDLQIPEDWLKVIRKEDGTWKKIIFYNTSVSALLKHDEKMLQKMEDVFRIFKENREEAALLWRPHPLIQATIESMRPQLWAEYEKIVQRYRAEGWGIYDDTADMDRAVVLSDAYYGDGSSLVSLYKKIGKFVEIQNVEIYNSDNEEGRRVLTFGAYTEGTYCLLPSRELNALFYMDLLTKQVKYYGIFPDCQKSEAWEILKVISYENKIIFFSKIAYEIWVLDMDTNEMKGYVYCHGNISFISNIEKVQDKVWVFPTSFNIPIVCLDLKKMKSITLDWKDEKYKNSGEKSFTRAVEENEILYLATRKKDEIILCIVNCNTPEVLYKHIKTISYINCIEVKENKLWLLGVTGLGKTVLQKFDIGTWKQEENIELSETKLEEPTKLNYFRMILFKNKIFLLPSNASNIIIYDILAHTEKILQYPDDFTRLIKDEKGSIFSQMEKIGQKLYLYPYLTGQILVLDMQSMEIEIIDVICDKEEYAKAFENLLIRNEMPLFENENIGISLIRNGKKDVLTINSRNCQEECGKAIYREVSYG